MASGFNATSFDTGLLGNINNQIANKQKQAAENQQYGDRTQIESFQQAAKEYDAEKAKQNDVKNKIEDAANDLAAQGNNGQGYAVSPAARITAKSAIEQGIYGKPEYHDYIMDAYEKTRADEQANPDKYNLQIPKPTIYDTDSNPQQTAALAKYGINPGTQRLEQVRQNDIQNTLQGSPGAKFGSINDFVNKQAEAKSAATSQGKNDAAMSPDGQELMQLKQKMAQQGQLAAYGYGPDGQPLPDNQQSPATGATNANAQPTVPAHNQPQQPMTQPQAPAPTSAAGSSAPTPGANPTSSAGAPPPSAGISLPGNAPPDQSQDMSGNVNASALTPSKPVGNTSQGAQSNSASPVTSGSPQLSGASQYLKDTHPAAPNMQERNWNALDRLTATDKNLVLKMSEGDYPIPSLASSRGPAGIHNAMLLSALTDFDPSANAQRFDVKKNFANGKDSDTITAINTAMSHVGNLRDAAQALQNGDTPAFNAIANAYSKQNGKPAATNYEGLKGYVSEELRKIYSNSSGGSLEELNQIASTLDKNQSPAQSNGMFRNVSDLLDGKMNALNSTYQRGMGLAYRPNNWMDTEAKNRYEQLKSYNTQGLPVDKNEQPIDPKAIAMLKANPQLAPQFEQQFGRPANAYIGGH